MVTNRADCWQMLSHRNRSTWRSNGSLQVSGDFVNLMAQSDEAKPEADARGLVFDRQTDGSWRWWLSQHNERQSDDMIIMTDLTHTVSEQRIWTLCVCVCVCVCVSLVIEHVMLGGCVRCACTLTLCPTFWLMMLQKGGGEGISHNAALLILQARRTDGWTDRQTDRWQMSGRTDGRTCAAVSCSLHTFDVFIVATLTAAPTLAAFKTCVMSETLEYLTSGYMLQNKSQCFSLNCLFTNWTLVCLRLWPNLWLRAAYCKLNVQFIHP